MVRMVLKNVIVGAPPLPSAVILAPIQEGEERPEVTVERERPASEVIDSSPTDVLPISVGMFEAASISRGVDGHEAKRPDTHMLLLDSIVAMGGTLTSVSLTRVEGATFFATLDVRDSEGGRHHIDARPSDAIALATRAEVDVLASEDVLTCAGLPNFEAIAEDERTRETEAFHEFVENLSPEDFEIPREG